MRLRKRFIITWIILAGLFLSGVATVFGVNGYVKAVGNAGLLTADEACNLEGVDCIIVLGCQVRDDGSLSHMLHDRLQVGVDLYDNGASPKLLMSGDHGREHYNEVGAMKQYALERSVPSENVFMDHAGFSTYETMYRAKEIFKAEKVVIVTQEYHLYRALYIARQFGLEAYGVAADVRTYSGQSMRDAREVLARCKDFAMCLFKPEPTYLGDPIPVSGNGDLTNDE